MPRVRLNTNNSTYVDTSFTHHFNLDKNIDIYHDVLEWRSGNTTCDENSGDEV